MMSKRRKVSDDPVKEEKEEEEDSLTIAAASGDLEHVRYLIERTNANVEGRGVNGMTPLICAVNSGKFKVVEYLVEKAYANVDARDRCGDTPITYASTRGDSDMVRYLVEEGGAHIDYISFNRAASMGNLEVVNVMIENGAVPAAAPLLSAAREGHLKMVRCLVENADAKVEARAFSGDTPLHCAAFGNHPEIVRYLIEEAKAKIEPKNKQGHTAFMVAALHGSVKVIRYLVKNTRFKNTVDIPEGFFENKMTPLFVAAVNRHLDLVRCLVEEAHASVNTKLIERISNFSGTSIPDRGIICYNRNLERHQVIRYLQMTRIVRVKKILKHDIGSLSMLHGSILSAMGYHDAEEDQQR